jgi:hypothetical protein
MNEVNLQSCENSTGDGSAEGDEEKTLKPFRIKT